MIREEILLVGAGGHARSCADVIEREGRFRIAGIVGTAAEVGGALLGYPIVAADDALGEWLQRVGRAVVAVGQIASPDLRIRLFEMLERSGCDLPVLVSPRATVSPHATVGAGTIVMHGAIVNAGAQVGRNCILNSQSLVEHDARVGDHCHIATAATVNGAARVSTGTFIGSGSCLREGIVIGERSVIGMGQRVLADCPPRSRIPERTAAP